MRILLLIIFLACFSSCSKKISPLFKSNIYVATANSMVINDSLKFSHKSYGDVDFVKEPETLRKILRENHYKFDNVLLYGKTNTPPVYEYFVLADSKKDWKKQSGIYVKDTIINNHKLTFAGIYKAPDLPESDFKYLSSNFKVGEDYNKGTESVLAITDKYSDTNIYFRILTEINNFPVYEDSEKNIKLQLQLTYGSFLANNKEYDSLIKTWEKGVVKESIKKIIQDKGISGIEPVKKEILKKTENHNLVMFNENHFYPNNRKLVTLLLPELKAQGFKYLALEALYESQDSLLNTGNHIKLDTGFYTQEQNYQDLITTAQTLGFQFVAYEDFEQGDRETQQAINLYDKTFGKDKNAKVLVLAGIDHINETKTKNGKSWMSAIFKEKYNIDPLTFSQTKLTMYRYGIKNIALVNSNYFSDAGLQYTDYLIINNLSLQDDNTNYELVNKHKEKVQVNFFEYVPEKKSYSNELPYRCFLVDENESVKVNLPVKKNKLILFDKDGHIIEEKIIEL